MIKSQKIIDIWIASDGSEHTSPIACEIHEASLLEAKQLSEQQERNRRTLEEWDNKVQAQREMWDQDSDDKIKFIQKTVDENQAALQLGVELGFWEAVENGRPIPWPDMFILKTREIRQRSGDFWHTIGQLTEHETTMAHLMAKLDLFDSVSEARKNGWNKPISEGEFWLHKKTKRVIVIPE